MKDNIGIILQARMGSQRLYGKSLMPFFYTTLLGWILDRLNSLDFTVITATSNNELDDHIESFCHSRRSYCFRGDELDVLDRFYACANYYELKNIIRLTADNPFPDLSILKKLTEIHMLNSADYSHALQGLPIGVGSEIFTIEALRKAWLLGKKPHHREHVNEYFIENKKDFKIAELLVTDKICKPQLSFTIDTRADYDRIVSMFNSPPNNNISTSDLISLCSSSV